LKVEALKPSPEGHETFRRDRHRYIPKLSGCYVLTNIEGHILYIGQSVDLCQRFNEHLDSIVKVRPTPEGRTALFYWRLASDIDALERGWLNAHRVAEARLPYLNTNDSPVRY
jgi:hypothetical protein